jgi:hypothetical protein
MSKPQRKTSNRNLWDTRARAAASAMLCALLSAAAGGCGTLGDQCDDSLACGEALSCVECSGRNTCFTTDALRSPAGFELACALHGDGEPYGDDYIAVGGTPPAPPGTGGGAGSGGGPACTDFSGYRGPANDVQLMSQCQAAYLYDSKGYPAQKAAACQSSSRLAGFGTGVQPCSICP